VGLRRVVDELHASLDDDEEGDVARALLEERLAGREGPAPAALREALDLRVRQAREELFVLRIGEALRPDLASRDRLAQAPENLTARRAAAYAPRDGAGAVPQVPAQDSGVRLPGRALGPGPPLPQRAAGRLRPGLRYRRALGGPDGPRGRGASSRQALRDLLQRRSAHAPAAAQPCA